MSRRREPAANPSAGRQARLAGVLPRQLGRDPRPTARATGSRAANGDVTTAPELRLRSSARRPPATARSGSQNPPARGPRADLAGGRLRSRLPHRQRNRSSAARRRPTTARRDRRHPHAADPHRRGIPRRDRNPRPVSADRRRGSLPAPRLPVGHVAPVRRRPRRRVICSRTASATSTSSRPPSAGSRSSARRSIRTSTPP
jgi:hypothetical protein